MPRQVKVSIIQVPDEIHLESNYGWRYPSGNSTIKRATIQETDSSCPQSEPQKLLSSVTQDPFQLQSSEKNDAIFNTLEVSLESQSQLHNEKRLFSWLFSKKVPPIPSEDERKEYPWRKANPLSRLMFWWIFPVLKKGYKRTLVPDDLFKLTPELKVEYMYGKWERHLKVIIEKHKRKHPESDKWPPYAIPYALFLTYFGIYTTVNRGVGLTLASMILILVNGLLLNHFNNNSMICGAKSKAILTKALLIKSFNLSARSKYMFPAGRITSLMSIDLARIDLAVGFQPLVLCFPIPVIISITILLVHIGVAALAGIGLFVVSLVVCVLLTKKLYTTREKIIEYTDERVSLMREILNNLKIIKFYAWEMAYKASITKVRNKEIKYLFTIKVLRNFITAYAVTLPVLSSMVSFITMWASGPMKSPGEVFSSLSLFAVLAQAIMLLPIALATGADALIGFRRCCDFLSAEEFSQELNEKFISNANDYYIEGDDKRAIEISHADFNWEDFHDKLDADLWDLEKNKRSNYQEKVTSICASDDDISSSTAISCDDDRFHGLIDVNLTINAKEFVIVVGGIGSGKTSLLYALAGYMKLSNPSRGSITRYKEILLCSSPWIQNATVRENILFGKPFDIEKYRKVLFACALEDDIAMLPTGDRTEIGERGITLSGGQKARINLARACYSDAEVLLLDDVISAVDSKVARHIVIHLFKGLLKDKTIVLATHQLGILEFADKVVLIDKGRVRVKVGSVPELVKDDIDLTKLIKSKQEAEEIEKESTVNSELYSTVSKNEGLSKVINEDMDLTGRTTTDEERAINAISWDIYKKYIELGSGIFGQFAIPIFITVIILATFLQVFTNTWLSFWMENKLKGHSDHFYVGLYVMFCFLTVIFTGLEFIVLAYMQDCSSNQLTLKAVKRILHVPISYIDTTPLGRILNRFTKDTDSLDNEIGEQMRLFIFPFALVIGVIILCICYLPYFAVAVPFLVIAFTILVNFYQGSSREIKRLEATQRSLVYNNFNETLTGLTTIRSFRAEANFIAKNDYFLNKMNEAYFLSIVNQRWLCVHLDLITSSFALIICMLCITGQFNINAPSTGLLLNYVMQLVGILSLGVRAMTAVENEMNSVERLYEYAFKLPQESAYTIEGKTPPSEWPPSGYVSFKDVHLRYRPNLPLVLKGLNIDFYPGEKVGICGRTGAGKSSIMTALYRLTELEQGKIEIDGFDISKMGLFDLRSKLSIIPQDPVLFQGTIRKNLDPFQEHDDYTLWRALAGASLIERYQIPYLSTMRYSMSAGVSYKALNKFHLDQIVEDDGTNFSLGEKQLIALARALVRNTKILVLDEATSSVDFVTDSKIQETIRR
ncbi:hypothetical protein KGF56_001919, partial [Candida oxycetoniae]